ncbi:MAG: hypothetical protein ABWK01_03255, partial [Infirmifilum sp.]
MRKRMLMTVEAELKERLHAFLSRARGQGAPDEPPRDDLLRALRSGDRELVALGALLSGELGVEEAAEPLRQLAASEEEV